MYLQLTLDMDFDMLYRNTNGKVNTMTEKVVRVTDKDGEELVFNIETDPNYIPATEYQNEDGYWLSDEEEDEE